jgi:peroxiredoxin
LALNLTAVSVQAFETAPAFTLTDTDGNKHSLSDYAGEFVILEWHNADCPFVKKHYDSGNMQSLQELYTEQGVIWFQINSSAKGKQGYYSAEELAVIAEEKGAVPTAILLDRDGKVGQAYGAKTTPHLFIIDSAGQLIYRGAIDSIPSADPADIVHAENYVVSAMDAIYSDQPITESQTTPYGCSVKY